MFAGATKLLSTRAKIASTPGGGWANDFSPEFIKTPCVLEILGAIGLILPAAVGIAPILVPFAAIGLGTVMIGAGVVTLRRREPAHALINLAYLALATFVAVGRL